MTTTLDTLVEDIYSLFDPQKPHSLNEENLEEFAQNLKQLLRNRFAEQHPIKSGEDVLRFSALGRKNRQVWYDAHPELEGTSTKEVLTPKTYFKFLYGDIIELLILFLCKEAGHSVESHQTEIDVNGVKGHIDAIIDGVVVDIKSASPYGYQKFVSRRIFEDDPFGYVEQLAGYSSVLAPGQDAAWIAFDKVSGDICVTRLPAHVIAAYPPEDRINELKEIIKQDTPPERCYPLEPDGKSGNMKLGTACSYCVWKFRCYPGLRTFLYSTGPRFLAVVKKTPDVPEIKNDQET
jgi:hypothetical protein